MTAARRARKKARKALRLRCKQCGHVVDNDEGDHDTVLSVNGHCWDGFAVVAWCVRCGWDVCS